MTENLRYGPDYQPVEPPTVFDYSKQEGFVRSVEMCNGNGACRKTQGGTMCPSFRATLRREATARAAGPTPCGWRCRASEPLRSELTSQVGPRGARPVPDVQGVQGGVPEQRGRGQAQGGVPAALLPGPAAAARPPADGPHPSAQPPRRAVRAAGQLAASAAAAALAAGEDRPASTAAAACRRCTPTTSAAGSPATRPDPAAGRAGRVLLLDDCFTTYNEPDDRPGGGARAGAGRLRRRAGRPALLRPADDQQGLPAADARRWCASRRRPWPAASPTARRSWAWSRAAC